MCNVVLHIILPPTHLEFFWQFVIRIISPWIPQVFSEVPCLSQVLDQQKHIRVESSRMNASFFLMTKVFDRMMPWVRYVSMGFLFGLVSEVGHSFKHVGWKDKHEIRLSSMPIPLHRLLQGSKSFWFYVLAYLFPLRLYFLFFMFGELAVKQ